MRRRKRSEILRDTFAPVFNRLPSTMLLEIRDRVEAAPDHEKNPCMKAALVTIKALTELRDGTRKF